MKRTFFPAILFCILLFANCVSHPGERYVTNLVDNNKADSFEGYSDSKAAIILKSVKCIFQPEYSQKNQRAFIEAIYKNRNDQRALEKLAEDCGDRKFSQEIDKNSNIEIETRYNIFTDSKYWLGYGGALGNYYTNSGGAAYCKYLEFQGKGALFIGISTSFGFSKCIDMIHGRQYLTLGFGIGLNLGIFGHAGIVAHDDYVSHYKFSPVTVNSYSHGESNSFIVGIFDRKDPKNKNAGGLFIGFGYISMEGLIRFGQVIWPSWLLPNQEDFHFKTIKFIFYSNNNSIQEMLAKRNEENEKKETPPNNGKDTKVEKQKEYLELGKISKLTNNNATSSKQKQQIGTGKNVLFQNKEGKIIGTGKVTQEFHTYIVIKILTGKGEVGDKVVVEK